MTEIIHRYTNAVLYTSEADLREADLREVNLSQSTGLVCASEWMTEHCECVNDGYIVYKRIDRNLTEYYPPSNWEIKPGSVIAEVPNPLPTVDCGCGVNFGTRLWCECNYTAATLWRCLLRWKWLADVVVPYGTNGKARCSHLQLLEVVE